MTTPSEENLPQEVPPAPPEEALRKAEEELRICQDKYLRLLAETENTRKRMAKEKLESLRFAMESVISEFLQPIDTFETALKHTEELSSEIKQWAQGFQMVLSQFKEALLNHGIAPFDSEGKPFDPHRHEAVETEESESHPPGTVIKEFVRGYATKERVIRHARVKVSKKGVNQ